ncbi:MAG: DUF1501 domain-containing protein, partial [Planctomycetales bacterium]|nr:DUF1501 domain-containing protein [Planctomycetales bacterium]
MQQQIGRQHCGRFAARPLNRRQMLARCANGFGAFAFTALHADWQPAAAITAGENDAWSPKPTHFPARARSVIFLYMDGGPSQVDTFDPKPALEKYHGQDPNKLIKVEPTQFNNNGLVMKSPWTFSKHGECGTDVSELFPHVAKHVDDLCVVRSMVSKFSEHTNANYFLHTGHGIAGRPSVGAW